MAASIVGKQSPPVEFCIAHARPSGLMQIKVDTPAKGHGLAHEARASRLESNYKACLAVRASKP